MRARIAWALALVLFVLNGNAAAQELPRDGADEIVSRAIRASLLGRSGEVGTAARLRRSEEERLAAARIPHEQLAENIEVLALASRRPIATLSEKRDRLADLPSDAHTRNLDRLLRRISPRQHFLEARGDRRYEQARRLWNALAQPVVAVAQGQFFPLISLPFEGADWLVVGRRFLTPEQRRELYLARAVVAEDTPGGALEKALAVIDVRTERRSRLSALQAKLNGDRAFRDDKLETANFWYRREMQYTQRAEAFREKHIEAIAALNGRRVAIERSLAVVDGDRLLGGSNEFSLYTDIVRALLLPPGDDLVVQRGADFRIDFPRSAALGDVLAAEAAASRRDGDRVLTSVQLASLGNFAPESSWSGRAETLLDTTEFQPRVAFQKARKKIRARFWDFLLNAEEPVARARSFTAEEARLRRRSWVARASALFITDIVSRAMILPFMDPFPRTEYLDAAATVPPDYFQTEEGRAWLRKTAHAQAVARRYNNARETWLKLGNEEMAAKMAQRAGRHLERQADRAADPAEAAAVYQRLLNAWPEYRHAERVRAKLAEARRRDRTLTIIARAELDAYPELWFLSGLRLAPALFDKDPLNGEVSEAGITVYDDGAYSYVDADGGRRVESPLAADRQRELFVLLEPRRRSRALLTELQKPLPRRRIPLAVEGGAFPGISFAPTLVPLDPDSRDRRLYY